MDGWMLNANHVGFAWHPCTIIRHWKEITFFSRQIQYPGCYIGMCLLWADFESQHYWLWVTPDARVGWAMSNERMEVMSVPGGGCLSFGQGIMSSLNLQNPSESHQPTDYMFIKDRQTWGHFLSEVLTSGLHFKILLLVPSWQRGKNRKKHSLMLRRIW